MLHTMIFLFTVLYIRHLYLSYDLLDGNFLKVFVYFVFEVSVLFITTSKSYDSLHSPG